LSFWQLIKSSEKIEIPIIQRDYAQGRADKNKIRNKFLDALGRALVTAPVELDFVYGSNSKGNAFQPLDGQQRLTTLFLLHWYIASKENSLDSTVRKELTKFTYTIRTSSNDFCRKIVAADIPIDPATNTISGIIKDAAWFYSSWEHDPTIKAMLIMLDAIHKKFKVLPIKWEYLTGEDVRPITFHHIPLADFGLSDDLYIKMNARGKQLSSFENFKADIIKHIDKNSWEDGKPPIETLSHKADTAWTDLFWDNGKGEKTFDNAFINVISNSVLCSWANRPDKTKDRDKKIQNLFNNPGDVSPEDFDINAYENLCRDLDIYSAILDEQPNFSFPLWTLLPKTENDLFSIIASGKATYPQRVLFYAQTSYLSKVKDIDSILFGHWMRVVRNIIYNSTIDSVQSFTGAINLINDLSPGSKNIYPFLSGSSIQSNFGSAQVKHETDKASRINPSNMDVIFEAEDTNFCRGKIEFILYCVQKKNDEGYDFMKMANINKVLKTYFNGNEVSNEFRRAMLTIGNMEFYKFWWSWTSAIRLNKHSLIKDIADLRILAANTDYRDYLKKMIIKLISTAPSTIIDEFLTKNEGNEDIPNWKIRLIAKPKLLDDHCRSHCIAVPDTNKYCYLLRVERPRDAESCKKIS
ncbi:DUF262 domain-containing protein, partial [Mucilaginibacter sp.]|uniref:DUF262 domain-containing protein n=1 Tax=Mucilaginibacter sp. TaxID=1882438 RepID=UPI002ED3CFF2